MDKIFKIQNNYETLFVIAMNKDWAEEYYFRRYKHPIIAITEIKDTRFITMDSFSTRE